MISFDWLAEVAGLELQRELDAERALRIEETRLHNKRVQALYGQLALEQALRVNAQRGLVPYVRALQLFHEWLTQHRRTPLMKSVAEKMDELGIWGIKLGYDPDRDPATSITSPKNPAWANGKRV